MKHKVLLFALLTTCATSSFATGYAADRILIYGDVPTLAASLQREGFEPQTINDAGLQNLDTAQSRLLVLAGNKPAPAQSRLAVSRFLQQGGNAIVVGTQNFMPAPRAVKPIALGDFARDDSYKIIEPVRDGNTNGEKPQFQKTTAPDDSPALRFSTSKRDMINFAVELSTTAARSSLRNVLTFQAKGDAYMDLLALEATANAGQKYHAFVPLSQKWERYTVSLADFIPAGWSDACTPYPLLDPAKLETIALGTNRLTLWQEKPMDFAIAQVALAENTNKEYAPTAALNRLKLPFKEIGIAAPEWIFDPFFAAANAQTATVKEVGGNAAFSTQTWRLPQPFADFPGTKMGTDNKKEYDSRPAQSLRRVALWQNSANGEAVGEYRLFTGGTYQGSSTTLLGLRPQTLQSQPALGASLARTVSSILQRPKIAHVEINTTAQNGDSTITPVLKITLHNPLNKIVRGQLQIDVAKGALKGQADFALSPHQLTTRTVELSAVPADFDFKRFDWQVTLSSAQGNDVWRDSVDVERMLIQAAIHMKNAQDIFPDGRMSHHYFADAYGARAMLAYTNFLKKNPQHLQRNRDLWQQITPEQMRATALRFGDMLVRRQNADGSVPMGYGEQSNSFNVADGGQISLGLGLLAVGVGDAKRSADYRKAAQRIIDFGETFYIDQARFERLQKEDPEQLRKDKATVGYYGLGVYSGGKRRESGPLWVLSDLLATQALLSHTVPTGGYRPILERNTRLFLDRARPVEGWYQAEAMAWGWLTLKDNQWRSGLNDLMRRTFLRTLYEGKPYDMYDAGSRGTLRALPLIYSRHMMGDSPNQRAALLKYVWTAASPSSSGSVWQLSQYHPKPQHGASISAMKFAQFSSIWAMELISPNSTLLPTVNFASAKTPRP